MINEEAIFFAVAAYMIVALVAILAILVWALQQRNAEYVVIRNKSGQYQMKFTNSEKSPIILSSTTYHSAMKEAENIFRSISCVVGNCK
jgi:hypothetical protein